MSIPMPIGSRPDIAYMLEVLRERASPQARETAEAIAALSTQTAIELLVLWISEDFDRLEGRLDEEEDRE